MRILFTGRKAHLTPELKSFVETKLAKLERVLDEILDVHVVLEREKHRHLVEIMVKERATTLTARAVGDEFLDAIGPCVDRLLAQAKKHTGRQQTRRKGRGAWKSPRRVVRESGPEGLPAEEAVAGQAPAVVRMGRVAVRAMSLREALLRAEENGPIVVFRDPASKEVGVIFRRPDGQFGLLEMET
jgi:putative sigma-54 modulation protein